MANELKGFVETASPEEKQMMVEILDARDNTGNDYRRTLGGREYEIGLLSGFQQLMAYDTVLVVPAELRNEANECIRNLARQRDMETARKPYSADDVRARWQAEFQASIELFIGKATV